MYQDGLRAQRSYTYTRQGQLQTETVLLRKSGAKDRLIKKDFVYNRINKLSQVNVNDRLAFDVHYDRLGRFEAIYLPLSGILNVTYDELSGGMLGTRYAGAKSWDYAWQYNDRGLLATESHTFGSAKRTNTFTYTYNGYLAAASQETKAHDYSPDGLHKAFTTFERDNMGRLMSKEKRSYIYGPQGEIVSLKERPELEWIYDEKAHLLAKEKNGQASSIFWGQAEIKSGLNYVEPLKIEGVTIGYLENETFIPAFADGRGTMLSRESLDLLPTAYGEQNHLNGTIENWGLAGGFWDQDLGLVRFGVRHYDPSSGLFVTPDSYFIENAAECVRSPLECNLYGYGRNNPLKYTDPTGNIAETVLDVASIGAGVYSISRWDNNTSMGSKALDVGGLALDTVAAALPFIPGGAGLGIKAARGADAITDSYKGVKEASAYLQSQGVPHHIRKSVLESFEKQTIAVRPAGNAEYGLRYHDGGISAQEKGRYLFETFPASRESLAIKPGWNQMSGIKQWKIEEGTAIIEGRAAGQGPGLGGGQTQKYINNLSNLKEP